MRTQIKTRLKQQKKNIPEQCAFSQKVQNHHHSKWVVVFSQEDYVVHLLGYILHQRFSQAETFPLNLTTWKSKPINKIQKRSELYANQLKFSSEEKTQRENNYWGVVGFDEGEAEAVTEMGCISSDGGVWSISSIVAVDVKERKGLVFLS